MWQSLKNIYHLINAFLANLWFGFPSRRLTVIGVTGTDGKTTTVSLIYHILNSAGYNVSMISSVGAIIGGKNYDIGFHVTTPSPWALQRFIKRAKEHVLNAGPAARFLILETTSHALDQYRVWGIKFDIGVLTNVTHEHLDYHKTYDNYVGTKTKLLKMAKVAVVNRDDKSYKLVKSKVQGKNKKSIKYGLGTNADVNPKLFPFESNLIGEFNKYNALAAIAVCRESGVDDKVIRKALISYKPPVGREEIVHKVDFTVMVDFAHTPNAFDQLLSSIKPSIKGRLIHVFGSAGLRDNTKRPLMGKVSSRYADFIVLTAEDPRSESVEKIMNGIESGIMNHEFRIKKGTLLKISDRKEAINAAIKMARKGDFVLISGKAHEKSMNYGKGEVPWDEFVVVKEALRRRGGKQYV
ncbi:MAG: hypothetical protein ACD_50C00311G0004 [uncultured bacterium]|nr:MAG: hypothetical protein ACD_50C00311G0004 [uncultured bacterium]OGH13869.1 MAG: hypothetical protein A2687_04885 [Candidatus Levybacteria bacterium RIFCSPHIGHO2_01_FULL_38_26]